MTRCWIIVKYLGCVLAAILLHAQHQECCIEEERLALLELKSYMKSYAGPKYDDSFSWSDDTGQRYNCCAWKMVQCNSSTGRVTELHLSYTVVYSNRPWLFNVTIFQSFGELINLDLSYNNINGLVESDGSTKISTLKKLRFLNLDQNFNVTGHISIGDLTSLEKLSLRECSLNKFNFPLQGVCGMNNLMELHLGENVFNGGLPSCLKNLSSLKVLDLSNNNFDGKFPEVLSSLRSLEYLDLSNNYFEGVFSLAYLTNLSNLHVLRLSRNMLEVRLGDPSWRPTFQLQTLGLRDCNLNKTFETLPVFLSHQTNLSDLDLSHNNVSKAFPTWLFNYSFKLKSLHLANNYLTGSLQLPLFTNMSLKILDISNNNFHDKLPVNFGLVFRQLEYLNLSGNHFEGPIPTSIGHMRGLRFLDMSNNNFSGKLPRRLLSDLSSLSILELSDNNIEGDVTPEYMNLPSLTWLKLSNNRFGGTIKDSLRKSFRLYYLDISNNSVTGLLPWWIGNFSDDLYSLSMSQNNLQGNIPEEICTLYLDLSQNNFSGSIPSCSICSFGFLHLHSNSLTGPIPNALSNCSMLETLDLSDNQLSGGIPLWINKIPSLTILLLAGNGLHGLIPHQLCQLKNINILDLSRNNLSGDIPICFGNMSFGFNNTMKYEYDPIYSDYSLGDATELDFYDTPEEVEFLDKNQFFSYKGKNLVLMTGLDLSCNKLTGEIPPQLGELSKIQSLNLSHNFLSGSIPSRFSNLEQVESLDLSYNNLSGTIPSELIELNFLAIFNVSYNNLSGRVPETGQFANFDESNYLGNRRLYGYLVNKPIKALPPAEATKEDEGIDQDHGGIYVVYFLWSFCMSCVTMFLATIVILYINTHWREAFFEVVDRRILWWLPISQLSLYLLLRI
ncbi:receptor-like protein 15 isoform X2 [Beta vulgaris subsp. vulgaris]|uniref:receptor-like protein 15 isoform X2 n=2 Tax=Beta vulgaris subsp. vulgaris TaxID=3555 RepID=UPI00053FAD13|nr:receptor-like protein 15 isoform X2 [Beta vulgaris subsp. vulgaris]